MDRFIRPQAMMKTRSQQLSEKADEQRRRCREWLLPFNHLVPSLSTLVRPRWATFADELWAFEKAYALEDCSHRLSSVVTTLHLAIRELVRTLREACRPRARGSRRPPGACQTGTASVW